MKFRSIFLSAVIIITVLSSCSEDNDTPVITETKEGIIISHEGSTTGVPGTVSLVSGDLSIVQNDVYNSANGEDLGVFQQSIGFKDDLAFIVVDNANTIAVVNKATFEKVAIISTGLSTPRYIAFDDNNRGYVTNWGDTSSATDDFIAVVDLSDYTVESTTIPVSEGPEQIVYKNNTLYVSHKGGFGINDELSIIQTSDLAVTTLEVGYKPDELVFDVSGNLWVLSEGKTVYDSQFNIIEQTPGALVKVNTTTNDIDTTLNFTGTDQPNLMAYDNGKIYYSLNSKIYVMNMTDTVLPTESIIEASFYGMNVRGDQLFGVNAGDFASAGTLKVYDLTTNEETNSIDVGVVPAKIYFAN